MSEQRSEQFDRLARRCGRLADRRTALALIAGCMLTPVAVAHAHDHPDGASGNQRTPRRRRAHGHRFNRVTKSVVHDCTWGDEAPDSPIPLHVPFATGTTVAPGGEGTGNFYGDGDHDDADNDYYATDWAVRINEYGARASTDGLAVYPVAAGTVTAVGWESLNPRSGLGYRVIIQHAHGVETTYGHLADGSAAQLRVNQSVQPGTPLGTVGGTGNSTGPHLHLRFRVNGRSLKAKSPRPSPMDGQKVCDGQPVTAGSKGAAPCAAGTVVCGGQCVPLGTVDNCRRCGDVCPTKPCNLVACDARRGCQYLARSGDACEIDGAAGTCLIGKCITASCSGHPCPGQVCSADGCCRPGQCQADPPLPNVDLNPLMHCTVTSQIACADSDQMCGGRVCRRDQDCGANGACLDAACCGGVSRCIRRGFCGS